jgi:AAA domain
MEHPDMSSRPRLHQAPEPSATAPTTATLFRSLRGVRSERLKWIIPDRLPAAGLTILEGPKGAGKSALAAALAAMLTGGPRIPPARRVTRGDVLWLTGEEDAASGYRPRIVAAGGDVDHCYDPAPAEDGMPRRLRFPGDLPQLAQVAADLPLRMVVLDTLSSHLPDGCDTSSEGSVRPVLEALSRLGYAHGCLILAIRHLRKDRSGSRLDQGLGSVSIAGVARVVLAIDQPDVRQPARILRVIASNQSAPVPPLAYMLSVESGMPVCTGWRVMRADEDDPTADQLDPPDRDAHGDAVALLRSLLATEWVSSRAVISEAEHAGISPRSLRRAKADLAVRSRRIGTASPAYWEWGPPDLGW